MQVDRVGPIEVIVAKKMSHQLILGNDSLREGGAILNLVTNTPLWHKQSWPLRSAGSHTITSVGSVNVSPLEGVVLENEEVLASRLNAHRPTSLSPHVYRGDRTSH